MKKTVYLVIFLVLSLSACQADRPLAKLNVELSDFAISPDHFVVQAGKQITFHVTNSGSIDHDLTLMDYGMDVGDSFNESDKMNSLLEIKVPSGENGTVTFQVPDQPGLYQVVCGLPGHLQAGMLATLEVVP